MINLLNRFLLDIIKIKSFNTNIKVYVINNYNDEIIVNYFNYYSNLSSKDINNILKNRNIKKLLSN
jgi:hypothetical protein